MTSRVGIELLPDACRIVDIDAGSSRRTANGTRVRSFAIVSGAGADFTARLASLRRRDAAVIVWGQPSDHRHVVVTAGSYEAMRAEALRALGYAGIETQGMWADIAPAATVSDHATGREQTPPSDRARRPVLVALAPSSLLTLALQPLVDAGIRVQSVATPAGALASIARLRLAFSPPGAIEAYIAIEDRLSCMALVRDGALMTARTLAWGYLDDRTDRREPRPADDLAGRLADEIHTFCGAIDKPASAISQLSVCGGLPDLRTVTERLSARLGIAVQALDSLFGIDAAHLPDPADEFRERSAEWHMAWAAAVDWPPPINLVRTRHRHATRVALTRIAVGAGVAAGLLAGWRIEQSAWWRSFIGPDPASRPGASDGLRAASGEGHTPGPVLPFDAVLGTILYSQERRLAVIDGRIVAAGDEVRGARVVSIAPDGVTLRDAQGRLRRLTKTGPPKPKTGG